MAVTLKTIAQRVGVSVQAVSYVMNDRDVEMRISAERSAEIRRVARELNYVPNASARAMLTKRTRQVGVLIHQYKYTTGGFHPTGMEAVMGINAGLEPSGNIIVIIPVTGDDAADRVESRVFRERLLDGLVMLEDVPVDDMNRAMSLVNSTIWVNGNVYTDHNCLRRDEVAAGRLAAEELFKLGYRKLLYADKANKDHYSATDRLSGVLQFAAEAGMRVRVDEIPTLFSLDLLPESFHRPDRDTAVLACDSYTVRRLQGAFVATGARPGHDFALACCDDASEFSWTWPNLSRVSFDRYAMGQRAAELILGRIAEPAVGFASELITGRWVAGTTALPAA